MDSGLLDNSPLNGIEFESDTSIRNIPLPDELPRPPDTSHLPKEILKSSTVETLLAQNEDLMARLKVSLRRLSVIELENHKLRQEHQEAHRRLGIAEDRTLVLKEKDGAWKEKTAEVERIAEVLKEKLRVREDRLRTLETEVARHRKYQERIRQHVKPHLMQLKEYARGLENRLAAAQTETEKREGQVRDVRAQIAEITKNSRYQVEQAERRLMELTESYERTVSEQTTELQTLRETVRELEIRTERLRRAEQRGDELENELVEVRRSKDEMMARAQAESRAHLERAEDMVREVTRLRIENEDLRAKGIDDYGRIRDLEKQALDQQNQLESLRFLYGTRSEENERLKLALGALEKLNVDLSSRIQELRSPSSTGLSTGSAAPSSTGTSAPS